jgi:uncharacterized membrane protein YfbV (UPF0208 family)
VLWNLVIGGVFGFLIGRRYRAYALLCATLLVIVAQIILGALQGAPWRGVATSTFICVLSLQGGYFLGLWLTTLEARKIKL